MPWQLKGLFGVHVALSAARWAEIRPVAAGSDRQSNRAWLADPADSELDRRQAQRPADDWAVAFSRDGMHMVIALELGATTPAVIRWRPDTATARARGTTTASWPGAGDEPVRTSCSASRNAEPAGGRRFRRHPQRGC